MNQKQRGDVELERMLTSAGLLGEFAECAGCGNWNRLVPRYAPSGAALWIQPAHVCGDRVAGGPSRLVEED